MRLLRKVFSIFVVLCLTLGIVAIKPVPTKAIQKFWMELSNPSAGANSSYKFHFSIEEKVEVHQWIKLVLPPGTTFKKFPAVPPPDNSPCQACQPHHIITALSDSSIEVKFNSHIELDPTKDGYREIVVTLQASMVESDIKRNNWEEYRFYNPPNPGLYTYKIATQTEPTLVTSEPVQIKAMNNFWMELSSPRSDANSEYKFHFSLEKKVNLYDWIKVVLPPGTKIKKTPTTGSCLVNQEMPDIYTLPDSSIEIKFNSHIEIDPEIEGYRDITVTISAKSLVVDANRKYYYLEFFNPPNPGLYTYKIATQAEPNLVASEPVKIQDYPLSSPIVQIEPNQPKELAGYSIDFDLNQFCDMKAQQDTINLQFPGEDTFSKQAPDIHRDWITVNESNLLELPTIKDNMLIIPIPYDLKSGQHVSIKIDSRVGIRNPEKLGSYELKIFLPIQLECIRSFPYYIASQPDPVVLKIEPPIPGEGAEFSILQTLQRVELNPLDTIYVRFPDTIKLPSVISNTEVLINNKPAFQVNVYGQIVETKLKSHVKGWMPLEIKFSKQAGIKLPRGKSSIQLELKLPENEKFIPTNPVGIT